MPVDGGVEVAADEEGAYVVVQGYSPEQVPARGRNLVTSIRVDPGRYMLSFQSRMAPEDETQRVFAQVRDRSESPLGT